MKTFLRKQSPKEVAKPKGYEAEQREAIVEQ